MEQAEITSRLSPHRAPAIALPADPAESAALVLRYIQTADTAFDRSAAVEAMTARVRRLADPGASIDDVVGELAGHAALLDALFQRWAAESIRAGQPDHQAKFAKLALASQASYVRAVVAIEGLRLQRRGKAKVIPDTDTDTDNDDAQ